MKCNGRLHLSLGFCARRARGNASGDIRRVGRKPGGRFLDHDEILHCLRPACFSTLCSVPGASSWIPSASSILITSRIFTSRDHCPMSGAGSRRSVNQLVTSSNRCSATSRRAHASTQPSSSETRDHRTIRDRRCVVLLYQSDRRAHPRFALSAQITRWPNLRSPRPSSTGPCSVPTPGDSA